MIHSGRAKHDGRRPSACQSASSLSARTSVEGEVTILDAERLELDGERLEARNLDVQVRVPLREISEQLHVRANTPVNGAAFGGTLAVKSLTISWNILLSHFFLASDLIELVKSPL